MKTESLSFKYPLFTRGILGGLFVGIITVILNLLFDYIYRKVTNYFFSEFVNTYSIIFFTIPTLIAAGIVYALIMQYIKNGLWIYIVLCIVLATVIAFIPLGPNLLPTGEPMPASARGLTLGIEIITGIMGAFAIPYFASHTKIWEE
ncbi:MAG: hypothetical protein JSR09_07410 [Bacteroidetes bacterium]|nr:hypothetical protein [Bacteroidota bacterium]MBS1649521.1 hypothetical protein [Bacteroidota bacterium]